MIGSTLSQGIGVAIGLQGRFDFAGVAAAGVGAGLAGASRLGGFAGDVVKNTAGGLANAATRSLIDGTDFGDNILAALPDIIAQTVGGLVADRVSGNGHGGGSVDLDEPTPGDSSKSLTRTGAVSLMYDDLPPIDGVQGRDEIVVTGQLTNAVFDGIRPLLSGAFYRDTTGFLPSDQVVQDWAKPRTSLLSRLMDPGNLKWVRRASVIGAVGDILFDAAPGGGV